MKAVLEIDYSDLNINLIEVLDKLFKQDVNEILIRKNTIKIEEFDKTLEIQDIISSLKESGHNELLLKDIENGFKNSSIYLKQ